MPNTLKKGIEWMSGKAEDVDHYFDNTEHCLQSWPNTQSQHNGQKGNINRHDGVKDFARQSMTIANKGLSSGQMASGNGTLGIVKNAVLGTSVGLSATGVGLLVTSSTFAGVNSGLAIKSAWSTHLHIEILEQISQVKGKLSCVSCKGASRSGGDHNLISNTILPAIITNKKLKRVRKSVSGVPIVGGMIASAHSATNGFAKRLNGTRGKKRHFHAEVLARHLVTHQCALAQSIVAELFSYEESLELMRMNTSQAGPLICAKMRST